MAKRVQASTQATVKRSWPPETSAQDVASNIKQGCTERAGSSRSSRVLKSPGSCVGVTSKWPSIQLPNFQTPLDCFLEMGLRKSHVSWLVVLEDRHNDLLRAVKIALFCITCHVCINSYMRSIRGQSQGRPITGKPCMLYANPRQPAPPRN